MAKKMPASTPTALQKMVIAWATAAGKIGYPVRGGYATCKVWGGANSHLAMAGPFGRTGRFGCDRSPPGVPLKKPRRGTPYCEMLGGSDSSVFAAPGFAGEETVELRIERGVIDSHEHLRCSCLCSRACCERVASVLRACCERVASVLRACCERRISVAVPSLGLSTHRREQRRLQQSYQTTTAQLLDVWRFRLKEPKANNVVLTAAASPKFARSRMFIL